jgi:hypothetical protein
MQENNIATKDLYLQEHSPTNHNNYYIWPDGFTNSEFLIKIIVLYNFKPNQTTILMKFKERIFIYFM